MKRVCVVIPAYEKELTSFEKYSIKNASSTLTDAEFVIVTGQHCDVTNIQCLLASCKLSILRFDNMYFSSIDGYNKLLLSSHFYASFFQFDFILIHQMDAFVFKNDLLRFTSMNLDYIGAPWIGLGFSESIKAFSMDLISNTLSSKALKLGYNILWKIKGYKRENRLTVGNGGLSLRKVKTHLLFSQKYSTFIEKWEFNEDIFWSIFAPLKCLSFKTATVNEALQFSFDAHPEICYRLSEEQLPFGCHAWYRNEMVYEGNLEFWTKVIPAFNISI
jgi:hypothetical protein